MLHSLFMSIFQYLLLIESFWTSSMYRHTEFCWRCWCWCSWWTRWLWRPRRWWWRCLLAESRCLPIFMGISYHRLRHKPVNAGSRPSPWNPLPLKRTCCQCSRLLKNSLSQSMSNFLPLWIWKTEEYIQQKILAVTFSVHNKYFQLSLTWINIQKSQKIKVVPI